MQALLHERGFIGWFVISLRALNFQVQDVPEKTGLFAQPEF